MSALDPREELAQRLGLASVPPPRFSSPEEVRELLAQHDYLSDDAIASVTFLIRLQCYEGLDESKALYEWNYRKQLLRIQAGRPEGSGSEDWKHLEEDIFAEEFLLTRPLLEAISATDPVVLLIDEVDRVELETEALLLEILSEYQVSIPEMGTVRAKQIPMVFLTSNNTRELSEALKRRCLYLYVGYPDVARERDIILSRVPGISSALAEQIAEIFTEVVCAPGFDADALDLLATKKNLRLLLTGGLPDPAEASLTYRRLSGGFLVQTRDDGRVSRAALKVVTRRAPTEAELDDLIFAFRVCKHVKSNAIVYAKGGATVGIGAGQPNRVDSARIAAWKSAEAAKAAGEPEPLTHGSVVASDAFFPFADGLEAAVAAGATAVIQPGGSIRDAEVIAAADAAGIAMVFTGMRHFRH